MPTFLADYVCENCSNIFEALIHNDDIVGCPKCGSLRVTQILGGHTTKLHDPEVLKQTLKQRSADHTSRELKKQASWKTGTLPSDLGRKPQ
jgi:putative FmdB family regulatory protein